MGLRNAPLGSIFVLSFIKVSVYLDVLIIVNNNVNFHLQKHEVVFDILYKAGLNVKLSMCNFFN